MAFWFLQPILTFSDIQLLIFAICTTEIKLLNILRRGQKLPRPPCSLEHRDRHSTPILSFHYLYNEENQNCTVKHKIRGLWKGTDILKCLVVFGKKTQINTNDDYEQEMLWSLKNWELFGGSWIQSPARCKICGKLTEREKGVEEETRTSQRAFSHSLIFIVLLGRVRLVKLV